MENLIEAIRTALRDDAVPTERRAGLVACREILAVLEAATEGGPAPASDAVSSNEPPPAAVSANGAAGTSNSPVPPIASATAPPIASATAPPIASATAPPIASATAPAQAPHMDPAVVATLVASLGKLPPEQLLDLAIARLRAALPPGTSVPASRPLQFQLIPLHHLRTPK